MSVAGTWNVTVQSPMGAQTGTLVLAVDGDRLTGTLTNPMGALALEDGRIAGNSLSWTMALTAPMPMTLEAAATVEGNQLTGSVKAGAFGAMPLNGTRA